MHTTIFHDYKLMFNYARRFCLLSIGCLLFSFNSKANNYYWVGGSGNWTDLSHWATTSGGSTLQTQIPTALDDVFFDANSFSATGQAVVFDPLTCLAHDIVWTGVTNTPTMLGSPTTLIKIYGSLAFTPFMNMNFAGIISFEATVPGKTITMAGKHFTAEVSFNGGGEWTLQDAFTTSKRINLKHGVLTSNNQVVNAEIFFSSYDITNSRTLNMGSSVFNMSGGGTCWWIEGGGVTVNCGTSVINCSNNTADFRGGGFTYNDLNFTGSAPASAASITGDNNIHDVHFFVSTGYISGNNHFNKVFFEGDGDLAGANSYQELTFTPGHGYALSITDIQSITGIFNATGNCHGFIDIHSKEPGTQATISHPAGTVNTSYLILKGINATGGANYNASNSLDLGNNTGWNITPLGSQNFYWIGNGGDWNDGSHWSYSNGGPPSGCCPSPQDDVFFDANSFSTTGQSVTINGSFAYCNNMNWSGVTNFPTLAGPNTNMLKIYGSLVFVTNMNVSFSGIVNFEATAIGKTITTAGRVFQNKVNFAGIGGAWSLLDDFSTLSRITLITGTLTSNNHTVNANEFYSTSSSIFPRALNMGSSIFNLSGNAACWYVDENIFSLDAGTSVINCLQATVDFRPGSGLTYYDVNFTSAVPGSHGYFNGSNHYHNVEFYVSVTDVGQGNDINSAIFHGDGTFSGDNIYNDLTFSGGHSYRLYSYFAGLSSTQTINDTFNANGSCGQLIDIHSAFAGQQAMISHPPGAVNASYLILKDISAIGGATFTAINSVDLGNNSGWIFNLSGSQNLYWIGNAGNWSDGNHWSFTSGGAPAGCSPTPNDNVYFDVNSFSLSGQSVLIDVSTAYCRDMNWTGVSKNPDFSCPMVNRLKIYGSLAFDPAMSMNVSGPVDFEAISPGKIIFMAGKNFYDVVNFSGIGGEWTLQDDFSATGAVTLYNGILNTANQPFHASAFYSTSVFNTPRTLNMGESVFTLTNPGICWFVSDSSSGLVINSGTSVINCNSLFNPEFRGGGGYTYYDLNFTGTGSTGYLIDRDTFHDVNFTGAGFLLHSQIIHDATFNGNATLEQSNEFHNLTFTAGYTYTLWTTTDNTQLIHNRWQIQGFCTSYIVLQTNVTGTHATFTKTSGEVLGYNIHIKDIYCTGGAVFHAYNSVDLGGNSGWLFSTLPPLSNPGIISGPSVICIGDPAATYHVTPVPGSIYYHWTVPAGATIVSGQGDTLIVVNFGAVNSGIVSVESFDGCNYGSTASTLAIVIGEQASPSVTLAANPPTSICPGTTVRFTATVTGASPAIKFFDFKVNGIVVQHTTADIFVSSSLNNNDQVTCSVTLDAGSCFAAETIVSNEIVIDSKGCESCILTIPNAISPNGDGINDRWVISSRDCFKRVAVYIYNRYGSLVYKNDNYQNEWGGTYKTKQVPDGTYYYVIKASLMNNRQQTIHGNISIVR